MTEKNTLSGRVKRYANVTSGMAGVAVSMAGQKLFGQASGKEAGQRKQAEALRAALGGLKGPLMKIAQILATIPDAVPEAYAHELAQLQADAPAMGWPFVKRRLVGELGAGWQQKFRHFSQTAAAAASLGQVHKAVTLAGQEVACKLQYPDMESAVEADLKQLGILLAVFEQVDKAISTKAVQEEIAARLREELDYRREAKHIALYRQMLANVATVKIPEVIAELSTHRLLTMTWLEGEKMAEVAKTRALADRNAIAMNMFNAWYVPFYHYGIIHGDPHMGNYSVRPDNAINLLDFGCIRIFPPPMVGAVIELYHALVADDLARAVHAYEAWGFINPSNALIEALNLWARFVYAPLLQDRTRLIEETNNGLYGRQVAGNVHAELRKLGGGITVPREFVFMDRAAIGLGSVFLRLKAEVNWHRQFHALIDGFALKNVVKAQKKLLQGQGLA